MTIPSLTGLDHVVVVVRDLDRAESQWRNLGFTISPRGIHSAHMGTANHTIMLSGDDYLELMGVLTPTERNAPIRELLSKTEGIDRTAFTTTDAQQGVDALKARGLIESTGPIAFSRPVALKDGTVTEARFDTFSWPLTERPGGVRLFACQHHTRDAVWIPDLMTHANGATRIRHVEIISDTPEAAAAHMSRLTDMPMTPDPDGAFVVASGANRGSFHFLTRGAFAVRHLGVPLNTLRETGAAAVSLACASISAATSALGINAIATTHDTVAVAPHHANGVLLEFVAD